MSSERDYIQHHEEVCEKALLAIGVTGAITNGSIETPFPVKVDIGGYGRSPRLVKSARKKKRHEAIQNGTHARVGACFPTLDF